MSVIIPARNEERWLRSTLDAAVGAVAHFLAEGAGSGRSAEIIVVDNGSIDATWDVARQYAHRHGVARFGWMNRERPARETGDGSVPADECSCS